ncbi:MAG TPA: ABC transporter ATP-binding protein [Clostridia bacterium]|nr:ABC transporter ATP-binding protein [Clostridia bacterium]
MAPILQIQNLTTSFKTELGYLKAINDVSFSVNKGEIVGLVGESGSGKSVTSFSIMRLLPKHNSRIDQGKILFGDTDLLAIPEKEMIKIRGKEISMIFQEPMTSLNPVFTIGDQIGEVFRNHTSLDKKTINVKTVELLDRVGIPRASEIIHDYPHQLSGGMRQRIMIAMAIALKPKILIADEPTTALDVTIQAQILDLIKNLAEEDNMAVVFISHNLGVVAELCQKVIVMYSGQFVEMADTASIFKNPQHPYTKNLLDCIPRIGMSNKKLKYIEGTVPHPADELLGCRFQPRCFAAKEKCSQLKPELIEVEQGHYCRCFREDKE